jgi:hypothetical protein
MKLKEIYLGLKKVLEKEDYQDYEVDMLNIDLNSGKSIDQAEILVSSKHKVALQLKAD